MVMSSPLAGALMRTFLGAGCDVGAGLVGLGKATGRLDDDVDAEVLPRKLGRVADLQNLDGLCR